MTVYFEGNGEPKNVSIGQARDQLILAIKAKRDEVLADPKLESYEDPFQRDRVVADRAIHGVLAVLDGASDLFPEVSLVPCVPEEDLEEAKAAGGDHFDPNGGTIGGALADYWNLVND